MSKYLLVILLLAGPVAALHWRKQSRATGDNEYIYVLHAVRPEMLTSGLTDAEANIQSQHVVYVRKLASEGVVLLYGRTLTTDASTFGIVIFKAESEAAARKIMEDDPGVKNNLQRAQLYPYRVAFMAGK